MVSSKYNLFLFLSIAYSTISIYEAIWLNNVLVAIFGCCVACGLQMLEIELESFEWRHRHD